MTLTWIQAMSPLLVIISGRGTSLESAPFSRIRTVELVLRSEGHFITAPNGDVVEERRRDN